MFLNKITNIFVSRTQNLCPQQMLHARANGETFVSATECVRNNVSSFASTLKWGLSLESTKSMEEDRGFFSCYL